MNCGICIGHLREKNRCPGCRLMDETISRYCRKCIIRNCPILKKKGMNFCSSKCDKYPCKRLKSLDKRYRERYGMSMIKNLENIKKSGIREFVKNEKLRWNCNDCKKVICVHRNFCIFCSAKR
ncbi:DUF3795 domain-containing protein [Candidatus Woesebacteria bacterium]|nr:DUF3795 domain-containing protein [Candidatus Woesebacteria bacterium]